MHDQRAAKIIVTALVASIIGLSLWFASPQGTSALTVNFPSLPAQGTIGQTYSFSVDIDVEDTDVFPIASANLQIINSSNTPVITCNNLPVKDDTRNYTSTETGNGSVVVVATTNGQWNYGFDNRTAYWNGQPRYYGYGYGYGFHGAAIHYSVTWTTLPSLTPGNYYVKVTINGNLSKTSNSAFTLSQQTSGGFGGGSLGGGGGPTGPGLTNLAMYTNNEGIFVLECLAYSDDHLASLKFAKGIKAVQKDGSRLKSVSIVPMESTPPPPKGSNIYGLAYELGPEGVDLNPSVTLTLNYKSQDLPKGFNQQNLTIAVWNPTSEMWEIQEGALVDTLACSVSIQINHFSAYTIIGKTEPASISVERITVSPSEAGVGDKITASAYVSNTGDLPGEYTVTFKLNGTIIGKQQITLGGNSSTTASCTIIAESIGDHEIEVNGKSAKLTIIRTKISGELSLKSLAIFPSEVNYGEEAIISIIAENRGDESCSNTVTFMIDGIVVYTQVVDLTPHSSKTVEFTTSNSEPGLHTVNINGQEATFSVKQLVEPVTNGTINWYLIGFVILVVSTISSIVGFRLRDRSRYIPPMPPRIH